MLNAIKGELVRGTADDDFNGELDEASQKAAANFRMHLRGLFETLGQLTKCADYLTETYQSSLETDSSLTKSGQWPFTS